MIRPEVVPATSHEFKKGMAIVVEGESQRVAATILTSTQKKLGLELSRPSSPSFQVGEKIRLIYWDAEPVAYYWQGEVLQVGGPGNRHLMISLLKGQIEQRKEAQSIVTFSLIERSHDATAAGGNRKLNVGVGRIKDLR